MKFDRGWVKRPDSTHQPTDHGQGETDDWSAIGT